MAEKKQDNTQEEEEKTPYERLNNTQKCAVLVMMLLGEDEAAEILKNLGPKRYNNLEKRCIQLRV